MLKINFEFRKGIFFIRLFGELNKDSYKEKEQELKELILDNRFKYIVINTNNLDAIDLDGLNYITSICYMTRANNSNLIICDRTNILSTLLNGNIPNISDEIEVL